MKKRIIASLFSVFLMPVQLLSQPDPGHYICYQTYEPITVDGQLREGIWKDIPWSEPFQDIEGKMRGKPPLQTRMKMTWDSSCLYIAAALEEPNLFGTLTNRDDIIYRDPDFEVFIDPDKDSYNYYELEINILGTEMDLHMKKPYLHGGKANLDWDFTGLQSAVYLMGSPNNPSDRDTGWIVEMAIPWASLHHKDHTDQKPVHGTSWRINFSRVEWHLDATGDGYVKRMDPDTGKPFPEENWVWSPTGLINMHIPERWGQVTFDTAAPLPSLWVWKGGASLSKTGWDSLMQDLDTLGIHGLLLGGNTPTSLRDAIAAASPFPIQVHCWRWTMNRGDAQPEWLDYNLEGNSMATHKAYVGYYKFMNPAVPEVTQFLLNDFASLEEIEGLKGIHMDYIRYVDAILPSGLQPKYDLVQSAVFPEFDYGYHPAMREAYKTLTGIDPVDLDSPTTDSLWLQFRLEQLTKVVATLRDQTKRNGQIITAAVFPTPSMSREMVRQDWEHWYLDAYFPMVYHNFYEASFEWITGVMQENKAVLPHTPVFCGLYLPALKQDEDLTKAMDAAMEGGADGVAFFNYGNFTPSIRNQIMAYRNNWQKMIPFRKIQPVSTKKPVSSP